MAPIDPRTDPTGPTYELKEHLRWCFARGMVDLAAAVAAQRDATAMGPPPPVRPPAPECTMADVLRSEFVLGTHWIGGIFVRDGVARLENGNVGLVLDINGFVRRMNEDLNRMREKIGPSWRSSPPSEEERELQERLDQLDKSLAPLTTASPIQHGDRILKACETYLQPSYQSAFDIERTCFLGTHRVPLTDAERQALGRCYSDREWKPNMCDDVYPKLSWDPPASPVVPHDQ